MPKKKQKEVKPAKTPKKSERLEALFRILVVIVTGIIIWAWGYLTALLIVINWLVTLITGKRSKDIAELVDYWASLCYSFWKYLGGLTNTRPFPFGNKLVRMSKFE